MTTQGPQRKLFGLTMPKLPDLSKYTPNKTTFTKFLPDTSYVTSTLSSLKVKGSSAWKKGTDFADGWLKTPKSWWDSTKGAASAVWTPVSNVASVLFFSKETRDIHEAERQSKLQEAEDLRQRMNNLDDTNGPSPSMVHPKYTLGQMVAYYCTLGFWAQPKVPAVEEKD